MSIKDSAGIEILATDTVMVTAWGNAARLVDTGIKRPIVRFGRSRVVILDSDNIERSVTGSELSVLRRDGAPGFEHNRVAAV
ncbi:hypothetical protein I5G67_gp087 [Mycobacterium phage Aminay]|uniref:Uncharacterized protein n=1 Tax=Mycobacterium phage Aminay TaxID=2250291 RepID=A0A345KV71_9CAUD|nr:hypothetical protein I5G67_gp087 [Mycobacterium phage Aminay]AXH46923.1 hypothetical protein SEA_AMINAY_87 [Mycobacterium phage Aminay]